MNFKHAIDSEAMSMSRNDIRKSKSKVRSYLRRCKDVLYGHSISSGVDVAAANITVKRDISHASNTSWYLVAEMHQQQQQLDNENLADHRMSIDHLPEEMKTNQIKEQEASDHTKTEECNESMPLAESQVNKVNCILFLLFVSYFQYSSFEKWGKKFTLKTFQQSSRADL